MLERVPNDPMDPLVGVDLLLNGHLIVSTGFEPPTHAGVEPFGVFAEHHEVHILNRSILEGTQSLVEQAHGTVIDVEIERHPGAKQDVARVSAVGHSRVAKGPDQDGIVLRKGAIPIRRHRDSGAQIVIGAPRKRLKRQGSARQVARGAERLERLGGDIDADAVAGNDRDVRVGAHVWCAVTVEDSTVEMVPS